MNEPRNISIRTLLIFIDVYEAQNFSVVARREGISASQVSRVIHQMEDALGQQLFYRNTRAIIPTESGHLFIRYARAMTGSLEEARRELNERALEPSGMVRINAPVFFGQRHVAPALPGLTERYPRLSIELTLTDDYIDPHRDPADVIFRIGALTDSSFHARVFGLQFYHLAASPDYIRRHGMPESPEDLARHKCLVYRGSSGANRWFRYFPSSRKIRLRINFSAQDISPEPPGKMMNCCTGPVGPMGRLLPFLAGILTKKFSG
nr:LysR family transcriptional regulator [Raoultella terrigena]